MKMLVELRKKSPKSIETDYGKELVNKISTGFLNKIYIKRYSRFTSKSAVLDGRFDRTR